MKITMDRKYQTKDGRSVRILCVDGPGEQPVVGIIDGDDGPDVWGIGGLWYADRIASHHDLVPAPEDYQMWVVVGRRRDGSIYTRCSLRLRDVWTLDEGDVLIARKMVEIEEGYFDHEEHTP